MDNKQITAIAAWVEKHWRLPAPMPIFHEHYPHLSIEDAYRVQQTCIDMHCAAGDRIIGYKAALTSQAMQAQAGINHPVLGTLLASKYREHTQPISLQSLLRPTLEPEVAFWLSKPLTGPCQPQEAIAAVGGVMAAFEIGDLRHSPDSPRSLTETICYNTFNGNHTWSLNTFPVSHCDWSVEGMNLWLNETLKNQATAITVLGNPIHALVFMVNQLAALGKSLQAGMTVLTGSIVRSIPLCSGDWAKADFSHLGQLNVHFN